MELPADSLLIGRGSVINTARHERNVATKDTFVAAITRQI